MSTGLYDDNNIFARIIRGEIPAKKLLENEHVLAFHDIAPKAPVHVLLIPKRACRTMDEFMQAGSEAELVAFSRALAEIVHLTKITHTGYRTVSNNGINGGQEVPHFHVHVLGGMPLGHPFPQTR